MKIGFDATKAFIDAGYQGTYSKSVIQALSRYCPQNDYILYTSTLKMDPALRDLLAPDHVAVRTPAFMVSKLNMGNIWRSTILGNTALSEGIDVFHGLTNKLPLITNRKLKTVVTIHDLNFMHFPHLYHSFNVEVDKRRIMHACKIADRIIATSEQTAKDIGTFFGQDPAKITVIPQTCHTAFKKEYAPYDLRVLCDRYKLPDDFILVTSQDNILDNNALVAFKTLVAMKDKVDIPLVIVGKIHKKYLSDLLTIAAKEKLTNRVILLKDITTVDIAMLYQLCRLYLHVATYPCDATPIKEALFSKVPVVCSRIPEFMEAGGLGPIYTQPGNEEELMDTIQSLLNNPSLTSNMIAQGDIQVQEFEDGHIARKLNNVYASLVKDPSYSSI